MNQTPQRTKRRILLKKFLLDYMYENWYLSSTVHDAMRPELPVCIMITIIYRKDECHLKLYISIHIYTSRTNDEKQVPVLINCK